MRALAFPGLTAANVIQKVTGHAVFDGLGPAAAREVASHVVVAGCRPGAALDPRLPDGLLLIVSGALRRVARSAAGDELTLALLAPDDACLTGWGADADDAGHRIEALDDSVVAALPSPRLEALAVTAPLLALNVARLLARQLALSERRLALHASQSATARVHEALAELAERFGKVTPAGVRIDLRLPQRTLASMASTSRETVSKELATLRRAGRVGTVGGRMVLVDRSLSQPLDGALPVAAGGGATLRLLPQP